MVAVAYSAPGPRLGSQAAAGPLLGLGPRALRRSREEVAVLRRKDADGCRRGWRPNLAGNPGHVDAARAASGRRLCIGIGPGLGVGSLYVVC